MKQTLDTLNLRDMENILVLVLAIMISYLVILTYKLFRTEQKNKELDEFLHGHNPTKKEKKQIQNEEVILLSSLYGQSRLTYVGRFEDYRKKPIEGDFARKDEEFYIYHNGKWKKIVDDLPRISSWSQ